MFCCWLIMCFPLNHNVKALTVHSYLRMKRASRQSFSTTTTWGTKMCKCPFSLSDNSDLIMEICYSHTKQLIQVVPLLLCDVLHSVSSWWQQIQICGDYMWLIVISALCWEYSYGVECSVSTLQDAAMDSVALQPQKPALSPRLSAWARLWNADAAHLCCLLIGCFLSQQSSRVQIFKVTFKLCNRSRVYCKNENVTIFVNLCDQSNLKQGLVGSVTNGGRKL